MTETVEIPRLHHRNLIAQRPLLDDLEKQWSCTVSFPSTEMASDIVTIKGPEWQVPHFKEGLLALVPESHQIRLRWSTELEAAIHDDRFANEVIDPIKSRICIDMEVEEQGIMDSSPKEKTFTFSYTRNDAGGLQDAIDLLMHHLLSRGVKAEVVQGRLSRPKSDSFEDFAPFFDSAVLQKASSQDSLNRPGSRLSLSGDSVSTVLGDKASVESGRVMSDAEVAFYNGDRRRNSGQDIVMVAPPGSSGSASSRGSFHSRAGSLDSDWEKISQVSRS